jgi:hypothetical protein
MSVAAGVTDSAEVGSVVVVSSVTPTSPPLVATLVFSELASVVVDETVSDETADAVSVAELSCDTTLWVVLALATSPEALSRRSTLSSRLPNNELSLFSKGPFGFPAMLPTAFEPSDASPACMALSVLD